MNEFVTIFSVELMRRLRSRAFVIGLLIGVVSIVIIVKLPEWLSGAFMSQKNVIVAGPPALTAPAARLLAKDFTVVGTQADSGTPPAKLLQQRKASVVALRTEGRKLSVTVYSTDPANFRDKAVAQDLAPLSVGTGISMSQTQIEKYLNVPVTVRGVGSKFENAEAANAAQGLAMTLLVLLYLATLINSQMLTTSIAEEKTNRIAELLVACVNPSNLLAAKIAVAGVLGLIQAACWAASAFLAGTLGAQAGSGASIFGVSFAPGDLLWFVTFFLIGYLQIATLFAASASLINRTEDLGSMNGPLIIPIVIAFYLAMYASTAPNAALSVAGSFVPLFSPFVLFTRVEVSNVPLWETSVAIAIQIAAIWAFAIVAGKVYRVGMLLYGRTPKFSQILRTLRA